MDKNTFRFAAGAGTAVLWLWGASAGAAGLPAPTRTELKDAADPGRKEEPACRKDGESAADDRSGEDLPACAEGGRAAGRAGAHSTGAEAQGASNPLSEEKVTPQVRKVQDISARLSKGLPRFGDLPGADESIPVQAQQVRQPLAPVRASNAATVRPLNGDPLHGRIEVPSPGAPSIQLAGLHERYYGDKTRPDPPQPGGNTGELDGPKPMQFAGLHERYYGDKTLPVPPPPPAN
jgi:hypothetical protein